MLTFLHYVVDYVACYFLELIVYPVIVHHVHCQILHPESTAARALSIPYAVLLTAVARFIVNHRKCKILVHNFIDHFQW